MRLFLVLVLSAVLLTAVVVGGLLLVRRGLPEADASRLAYSGADGNIHVIAPDGQADRAVTTDGQADGSVRHAFPTWSQEGRLAFLRHEPSAQGPSRAGLLLTDAQQRRPRPVYESDASPPFYLYWSPRGDVLTFLTQEQGDIALRAVDAQTDRVRVLDRGAPYYLAWAPDGSSLMVHVGGTVRVTPDARIAHLGRSGGEAPRVLPLSPGAFLAPDWSPQGDRVLVAVSKAGGIGLLVTDLEASLKQPLVDLEGRIAFGWSPVGDRVAYLLSQVPTNFFYGSVSVLPGLDQSPVRIGDQPAMAFFWSPDGERLALLVPEQGQEDAQPGAALRPAGPAPRPSGQAELRLVWYVTDGRGGDWERVAAFRPTPEFSFVLPYFDQYAHSLSFWSPDSSRLAFAGHRGTEATPGIWVVEARGGARPVRVADGTMVSWSWR